MPDKKISKNYFTDFLNFLPMAVCFIDENGYIIDANNELESLIGYKKHELVDSKLNKIFSDDDAGRIMNQEFGGEEFLLKGKETNVPVNLFSKKREGGKDGFIALSDLSKAKEIEREVEEKVKELERFNRLATGRELRMVELKREKSKLEEENQRLKGRIIQLEDELNKTEEKEE